MFRIGHISDLHFGNLKNHLSIFDQKKGEEARGGELRTMLKKRSRGLLYPSTFDPDIAQALLRQLDEQELARLDALLVTGDLATTGANSDLEMARDYICGVIPQDWNPVDPAQTGTPLPSLLGSGVAVAALPGNHDRYDGLAMIPAVGNFEAVFGDSWDLGQKILHHQTFPSRRVRVLTLDHPRERLIVCLADLSLDSAHAGEGLVGYLGQGRATAQIIADLLAATRRSLSRAKELGKKVATIWAVHYPPAFGGVAATLRLLGDSEFLNAAQECGVDLVMAGHTHEARWYNAASTGAPVSVLCCGASTGISAHRSHSFATVDIRFAANQVKISPTHYVLDGERRAQGSYRFVSQPFAQAEPSPAK